MVRDLGQTRLVSEVERISQSHQKLTTKMIPPPKPNHLRNRLDTTLAPLVFPKNDLQNPIKFVSTSGKVFFGNESGKASEGKPVEELSGEKPSEQPQPKPKPKFVRFHCGYCGRDGHKDEFCFKRKREERVAKEWVKDRYGEPERGGVNGSR
jgi:hypothetical protein